MHPPKKKRTLRKVIIFFSALLLVGGLGYGAWYFLLSDRDETTTEESQESQVPAEPVEVVMEEYASDDPALSFSYPSSWNVVEEDGTLLVTSPQLTYQTAGGNSMDGYFKLFLRQTARDEDATYIGRGVASLPSETLTYSDPAPNQREETSISFFGLNDSDNFGFFFIAGNFSLQPGDILGGDYGREEGTYIIGGGYASDQLEDDLATHPVPLSDFDETEAYEQALEIIRSIRIGRS